MKKIFQWLLILTICLIYSNLWAQYNPIIDSLARYIHPDSLALNVQEMEAFGDRLATRNNKNVAEYLVGRLKQYGIENATIDSFHVTGNSWLTGDIDCNMYNVKGSLMGEETPDSIVIIGAHLDAISYNSHYQLDNMTPGADDNASGIAIMLEMARIIHLHQLIPKFTIAFMAYDGEELGLIGSRFDARKRADSTEKVILMINNDMVGNQPDDLPWEIVLHWYDNAIDEIQKMASYCNFYTNISPIVPDEENNEMNQYSDSYAYFQQGFKAVFAIESIFSPYYHSLQDSSIFCNFAYMADAARMNFAALFEFAELTLPIDTTTVDTIPPIDTVSIAHLVLPLENVILYPNPASNFVQLQLILNKSSSLQIQFTDITGKTLSFIEEQNYDAGIHHIKLNCQSYPSGIYLCHVKGKDFYKTMKWIISK